MITQHCNGNGGGDNNLIETFIETCYLTVSGGVTATISNNK